jgi:hypothetical protein
MSRPAAPYSSTALITGSSYPAICAARWAWSRSGHTSFLGRSRTTYASGQSNVEKNCRTIRSTNCSPESASSDTPRGTSPTFPVAKHSESRSRARWLTHPRDWRQAAVAGLAALLVVAAARRRGIHLEKELVAAMVRGLVQIVAVGSILLLSGRDAC